MPTLAIPLAVLMEVVIAEVGFMNHFQLLRGDCPFSCTSLVPSKRSLSLFTCSVKSRKSVRRLTALSTGKPSISADKLCKIIWTIKADLEDGQLLYITGDPAVLGCWKLDMAILMSPTEHANIWKAEFKIACGLNFKYTYFIKGKSGSSSDILWKPGPEFFLSVPPTVHGAAQILVRDSWIRSVSQIPAARACAHYIEDMYPLEHTPISLPVKDEEKNMNQLETDIIKLKALGSEDEFYYDSEDMVNAHNMVTNSSSIISANFQPIEEPWLLYPPSFIVSKDILESDEARIDATVESQVKLVDTDKLLHEESSDIIKLKALGLEDEFYYDSEDMVNALYMVSNSSSICSDNFQPIEEPWLLYPPSFIVSKDILESDEARIDGSVETQVKLVDTDKLLHEESSDIIQKDPVSTIILINSSICTMQRIAVLEDEKLVELLLEPVKNNVQCDSVYIGIVTKLVPHLGGAFVNIGSSRPSLMDIKHNREPFIFPPFRQRTKKEDLQASSIPNENNFDGMSGTHSEDGSLQSPDNDYDEQEGEDDFDISEVLKENVNGSLVDDGEVEADFEDEIDGNEVHIEEETNGTSLTTGINGSVSFKILQDKDTKGNKVPPEERKWTQVRKGTKIIVQVVKEGLGTKGPTLTAYPKLRSRFWILMTRCDRIGVSKKISGAERTRLKVIAKTLQPQGFGLTVRTVAAGHSLEELQKDLEGLLSTWKNIMEQAKSAALAADEGIEGAVPVIMHTAMGQTLSVVQDYFSETVKKMVVDSPRTYHEVTRYLREIAPDLCDRVELYDKSVPLFDEFNIEGEIDNILSKRVPLANGGSLVIEQTEALVSIDVNGGHGMLGHGTSQEKAILDVNLVAAKQIARELRLRDIGGIIVVDFIDMTDEANKRLVYEEAKKAVERDRSLVKVSELSRHGLMEITRKRVRPSVTFMVSEPCSCCHGTGRVEALETSFSKIEQQICRLLATMEGKPDPENPKSWPKFILRVDRHMCDYLTAGKKTRLAILSSSLKVWILLKVARGFTRGTFEVKSFTDENEKAEKNQYRRKVAMSMLRSSSEGSTKKPGQNVNLVPVKKLKSRRK